MGWNDAGYYLYTVRGYVAEQSGDTTPPTVTAELDPVKVRNHTGTFLVSAGCSDSSDPSPALEATLNGVPVENGQKVFLVEAPGRSWHRYNRSVLHMKAASFELEVTCTDDSSNTSTASAEPEFRTR